jgi:hypothetical protein
MGRRDCSRGGGEVEWGGGIYSKKKEEGLNGVEGLQQRRRREVNGVEGL